MARALSGSRLGAATLPTSGAAAGLHVRAAPSVTPHVSVLGRTDFTWSLLLSQLPSGSLLCPIVVLEAKMVNGFYQITFMPRYMLLNAAVTQGDLQCKGHAVFSEQGEEMSVLPMPICKGCCS